MNEQAAVKTMVKRYAHRGVALFCLLSLSLGAQGGGEGRTLFDFVNINYDARSVALAGASVALPNGCYGIFSNPASLGYVSGMQAVVGFRPRGDGIFGMPIAYALHREGIGTFGAALYGLTSGNVAVTDIGPDGGVLFTDQFSRVDNMAGSAVWARRIGEYFSAGAAFKGFYTAIKGYDEGTAVRWSADGLALDCGVQCIMMNSRLVYGFVARNIGFVRSGFESGDNGYSLPSGVEIGVSYVPRGIDELRLIADLAKKNGHDLAVTLGGEFEAIQNQLVVRAGYSLSWSDLKDFRNTLIGESDDSYSRTSMVGLCLGAGFRTEVIDRNVQLDAALEFMALSMAPVVVISMLVDIDR
ncbi:MAG: hypothetical protein JXA71_14640 [Chitinispirillaceae bacterium]|nr:hypothetical protein [Chitinispirillaceae bacterium]